jgi:hypothetical protein
MTDEERYRTLCRMIADGTAFGLMLNANDTFGYACADSEMVDDVASLHEVIALYAQHGYPAVLAWMEKRRGEPVLQELRALAERGRALIDEETSK